MEGDYLNIINNLKNASPSSWTIEASVRDSIEIINYFDTCYISHILREGNMLSNFFANFGVRERKQWDLNDPIPYEEMTIINNEC